MPPGERVADHVLITVYAIDAPGAERSQERRAAASTAAEIQENLALDLSERCRTADRGG